MFLPVRVLCFRAYSIAAAVRSLMRADSNSAIAAIIVNIALPMRVLVSMASRKLTN